MFLFGEQMMIDESGQVYVEWGNWDGSCGQFYDFVLINGNYVFGEEEGDFIDWIVYIEVDYEVNDDSEDGY